MAAPVVKDGVWQAAHPTLMNCARPAIVEGVGGLLVPLADELTVRDLAVAGCRPRRSHDG